MKNKIQYYLTDHACVPHYMGLIINKQSNKYDIFNSEFNIELLNKIKVLSKKPDNIVSSLKSYNYYDMRDYGSKEESKNIFHFFTIICPNATNVVFFMRIFKRHKIWVNFDLFCITNPREQFLTIKLKKGINYIVIETPWAKPEDAFYFYMHKLIKNDNTNLFHNLLIKPSNVGFLYTTNNFLNNGEPFVFGVYPNDNVNVNNNQKALLTLKDVKTETTLIKEFIDLNKRIELNVSDYVKDVDVSYGLYLNVTYLTKLNTEVQINKYIYLTKLDDIQNQVIERTTKYLNSTLCNNYDRICLQFKLDLLNKLKDNPIKNAGNINDLYRNLNVLETGTHLDFSIYRPLSKRIFFESKLDGTIKAYHAYVPPKL